MKSKTASRVLCTEMAPDSFEIIWKKPYTHLGSLIEVLESAADAAGEHPSMLCVDICQDMDRCKEKPATVVLEAEGLSDRSVVYNVYIH